MFSSAYTKDEVQIRFTVTVGIKMRDPVDPGLVIPDLGLTVVIPVSVYRYAVIHRDAKGIAELPVARSIGPESNLKPWLEKLKYAIETISIIKDGVPLILSLISEILIHIH